MKTLRLVGPLIGCALLTLLLLPACQNNQEGVTTPTTEWTENRPRYTLPEHRTSQLDQIDASQPVSLTMLIVDYVPGETDVWLEESVRPEFQRLYPHVTLNFDYITWGEIDARLAEIFADEGGADLINMGSEFIAIYGDQLAGLNADMQRWGELDKFVPATLETVTWRGQIRGLPWLTAPRVIICRQDLLAELGYNEAPTTFNQLLEIAAAATVIEEEQLVQQGYSALGFNVDWQEFITLYWSLGGELYDENGFPTLVSPEAIRVLSFIKEREALLTPTEGISTTWEATPGERLIAGRDVCQWNNLTAAPSPDDPIWEQLIISPGLFNPEFDNSEPVVQIFNDWLAIPEFTPHRAEAVALLQFLGSPKNLNRYNEDFGFFPPRYDAWYGFVDNPVLLYVGYLMDEYGVSFSDVREPGALRDILNSEMAAMLEDDQSIEDTAVNIQTRYTQVLRAAGRLQE